MNKQYELTVMFHPDLEMNLQPALDKVKKLIEDNGGKILKEELDGKKRLYYRVKGQDFAVYYFYEVDIPEDAVKKVTGVLDITDEVLRHLIVSFDERKIQMEERRKARKEAEAAADADEDDAEEETNEEEDN